MGISARACRLAHDKYNKTMELTSVKNASKLYVQVLGILLPLLASCAVTASLESCLISDSSLSGKLIVPALVRLSLK